MASPIVWSTTRLQTRPRVHSPATLQRSRDGQLLLVGDYDLFIITPDPDFAARPRKSERLKIKTSSVHAALKHHQAAGQQLETGTPEPAAPAAEKDGQSLPDEEQDARLIDLKLARVSVPSDPIVWERQESYDFRTINTGMRIAANNNASSERWWRAAVWSPSSLSSSGGCMLAALTSSNEVVIFEATRDPLSGTWEAVDNVTTKLLESSLWPKRPISFDVSVQEQLDYEVRRVFDAQTTCISWSSQPDQPASGAAHENRSLLALGSKGGLITLWQWSLLERGMVCCGKGRVEEEWIVCMSWSDWELDEEGDLTALLAYSTLSGAVRLLKLTQGRRGALKILDPTTLAPGDKRPLTALRWLTGGVLAWAKAGEVFLERVVIGAQRKGKGKVKAVHPATSGAGGPELQGKGQWRLKRFGAWAGSSRLSVCCGIDWYNSTSIVFSLDDGSHHLFTLSSSTDLSEAKYDLPLSRHLTTQARALFESVERPLEDKLRTLDQASMRVSGCLRTDGCSAWLQEPTHDYDLAYTTPMEGHATFVLAELPTVANVEPSRALDRVLRTLTDRRSNYLDSSPLFSLFPSFLPFFLPETHNLLPPISYSLHSALIPPLPQKPPLASVGSKRPTQDSAAKIWFEEGVRGDLWGFTGKGGGRQEAGLPKRLGMAEFFAERTGPMKDAFAQLQDELAKLVQTEATLIILGWVAKVQDLIRHVEDKKLLTLLTHVVFTSLLRPSPNAPYRFRGAQLSALVGPVFDLATALDLHVFVGIEALEAAVAGEEDALDGATAAGVDDPGEESWEIATVEERCPACGSGINFEDHESALCSNGHEWDRCSLTLAIISRPQCRRCIHCARPTLLPPSSPFSPFARSFKRRSPAHPAEVPQAKKSSPLSDEEQEGVMGLDVPLETPTTDEQSAALPLDSAAEEPRAINSPATTTPGSPASTVAGDVNMRAVESDSDEEMLVTVAHDVKPDRRLLKGAALKEEENDSDAGDGSEPWLADALLEATTCCLYCGGRFALAL